MIRHTGAVARGAKVAPVIADLPIGTYASPAEAVVSAQQLVAAGASGVKLEGGAALAPQIRALAEAGIPVLAHIGMLPQHIREEGGYKVKGRTTEEAGALRDDAAVVQAAGAFAVVLEIITTGLAAEIGPALQIPTIGIGSGAGCDGQILVLHDLVGLYPWFKPKFAKQRADTASAISGAVANTPLPCTETSEQPRPDIGHPARCARLAAGPSAPRASRCPLPPSLSRRFVTVGPK